MKRIWNPIVIALVLAIGAGLVVFWYTRGAEDRAIADQQPVGVLVSTQSIPTGTTLQAAQDQGLADTDQVPLNLQPVGSIPAVSAQNSTLIAQREIPAGQVLMTGDFAAELPKSVSLSIPEGLVAVSVLLEDPAKIGSFLRPESEIAIFDTTGGANTSRARATRLLLDRVKVLAIGPVTARDATTAGDAAWSGRLVTVAVDQTQAQKLVHGIQTGALYMALLGDNTVLKPNSGVSDSNLFN